MLSRLSPELLDLIAQRCDLESLRSCRASGRLWHGATNPLVFKTLTVKMRDGASIPGNLEGVAFGRLKNNVRSLAVSCSSGAVGGPTRERIKQAVTNLRNIDHVDLTCVYVMEDSPEDSDLAVYLHALAMRAASADIRQIHRLKLNIQSRRPLADMFVGVGATSDEPSPAFESFQSLFRHVTHLDLTLPVDAILNMREEQWEAIVAEYASFLRMASNLQNLDVCGVSFEEALWTPPTDLETLMLQPEVHWTRLAHLGISLEFPKDELIKVLDRQKHTLQSLSISVSSLVSGTWRELIEWIGTHLALERVHLQELVRELDNGGFLSEGRCILFSDFPWSVEELKATLAFILKHEGSLPALDEEVS